MVIYFLDTYAMVEMMKGKAEYKKFLSEKFKTTMLNLYELYYSLLRDFNENISFVAFTKFLPFVIEIKNDYIFSASKFKLNMNKRNISYAGALGYSIANLECYKFLTGDKEFEGLDNVEFVK